MSRLATLARPADTAQPDDLLAGDHIGFDAWLLPPEEPGMGERAIRLVSTAAGPVVLAAALACTIAWIV